MTTTHRPPVVDVIKMIRVIANRGIGTPEDVVREVTYLYQMDGRCIVERDPVAPTRRETLTALQRLIEAAEIALAHRDANTQGYSVDAFAALEPLRYAVKEARK